MPEKAETETVAIITLHRVSEMHKRGRKAVADYLRKIARDIEENHEAFDKKVVCRYIAHRK